MPKKEEKLKELESKMEDLSKQLGDLNKLLLDLHIAQTNQSTVYSQWIEEQRKKAEETEKKFEIQMFYRSLVLGLVLGILGNLFASYYMKALEIFAIRTEVWIAMTFGMLIGVLAVNWILYLEIKKLIKKTSSS